jgi:hypothetical protein
VFRNTLAGDRPNWVGLHPVSGPNSTQFANCSGSAALSAANPAQFGKHAHTRGANLLAILPHCQTRPQSRAENGARCRGRRSAPRRRGRAPAPGLRRARPYRGASGRAVNVAAAAPSALTLARSVYLFFVVARSSLVTR